MSGRNRKKGTLGKFTAAALAGAVMLLLMTVPAMAADNTGTGDIAGDGAALNSSNTFSLFSTTMSLTKMAFLTDGTQLASGATLPRSTEVSFVIYIDNTTNFPLNNVSIQDVLDPTFAYQTGTIKVGTIGSPATEVQIYTAANTGGAVSDGAGDDAASYNGTDTISVGTTGGDTQVDVPANTVWAVIFNVLMQ